VTVSTGGVITGFNFVPGAAATMTSPTSVPVHLLALEQAAQPGALGGLAVGGDSATRVTSDSQLRSAIVNVAGYYLRLAKTRTPAQMEALIWDNTSSDGTDHGDSCAAFASLTLELAAQTVGLQSWATGGTSYPWPLPEWADVRVQTNPASPAITSLVADAQAHERWHAVGDGYQPQPGDWAVYNGHVEVVTKYAGGVLDTIGADSLPGLTVNAHSSGAPLAEQGVVGFVDNGNLKPAPGAIASSSSGDSGTSSTAPTAAPATGHPADGKQGAAKAGAGQPAPAPGASGAATQPGGTTIPGVLATGDLLGQASTGEPAPGQDSTPGRASAHSGADSAASIPGLAPAVEGAGAAAIPGATTPPAGSAAPPAPKHAPAVKPAARPAASPSAKPAAAAPAPSAAAKPAATPSATSSASSGRQYSTPGTQSQQAFISLVAPGAVAAQQRYGVPAAVTIAQAIEESAWGQSGLAAQYHNLFGIKGSGPAGSVSLPTSEFEGGQWVTIDAQFRVYHNDAESIADHAELLATSGYYTRAMADRGVPDAFANDLTGVYATDPNYGANLIALMKLYNLYQYAAASGPAAAAPAASPSAPAASPTASAAVPSASPAATPAASPTSTSPAHLAPTRAPAPAGHPAPPSGGPAAGAWHASVPGVAAPGLAPAASAATSPAASSAGAAAPGTGRATGATAGTIPGLVSPGSLAPAGSAPVHVTPGKGTRQATAPGTGSPASGGRAAAPAGAAAPAAGGTGASIPGLVVPAAGAQPSPAPAAGRTSAARGAAATASRGGTRTSGVVTTAFVTRGSASTAARGSANARAVAAAPRRYQAQLPNAVATALFAQAKAPLARGEHLYRDVAADADVSWKMLAAIDWMQCKADPRYSPVQGEKLGSRNGDGTCYATKSGALAQCACDLVALASAIYGIDLTARRPLSVRELAAAFAAFRWGALLRRHGVSAMEFPYSVAGLTSQHQKMHWPSIDAPDAPDRPGGRFREPFGAVPVVLSLGYPATV